MSPFPIIETALISTIAVGIAGGLLAWRERPEPGSVSLAVLLAGQCWWSATTVFRLTADGAGAKTFWVDISWIGIAILPVAWLVFCLAYTGHDSYLRPRYLVPISIVPVVTMVVGPTNPFHHLVYEQSELVVQGGALRLVRDPGVWFWLIAAYTYVLGLLGAIPLLAFVRSDLDTFRGQSLALLTGLVAPWLTNALFLLGVLPTGGIDPTPVAFSISGVAFLGALTRFQLLGTSPAPIRPARKAIYDQMEGGIIVLDRHDHIVDLNQQAAAALGGDDSQVLGKDIDAVIPDLDSLTAGGPHTGQRVFTPEEGAGTFDISLSTVTDSAGRNAGTIITLHDISEYIRQQQRLEVLNRVFRHNIRTNTQVIISHVDFLASDESPERAAAVQERALEIEAFSDKIRSILDVFESGRHPPRPMDLETILSGCRTQLEDEYPEVSIDIDLPATDEEIYVDSNCDRILEHILDNAAEHNDNPDSTVMVAVDVIEDDVRVAVSDNGPGIEDIELTLLNEGAETPLQHGSGLGLALIVWGTEIVGGTVRFQDRYPTGTRVIIQVPTFDPPTADE